MSENRVSRRKFLQGTGAAGVAGLVVGGAAGAALGGGGGGESGGSTAKAGVTGRPIKIGSALPLTGPLAAEGEEARRGSIMAVEEINAAGGLMGHPIEHLIVDMGDTSPDKVKTAYSRLIDRDKVDALIISYLFASGPDFDIVSAAGIPYVHHNALSDSTELVRKNFDKYWMIFQDDPTERAHGVGFIPILKNIEQSGQWKPRNKSIFIITDNTAYATKIATTMRDAIAKEGWEVLAFKKVVSPFTEWEPILGDIRRSNPDVIFNTDYAVGDVAAFQNQFMQNPTKSLMYQQFVPSTPEYLKLTGERSNGVIWATVQGLLEDDLGTAFAERYEKRWGDPPGGSTGPAIYDSIFIYADAVRRAGGPDDRKRVADEFRKTIYRGTTGSHSYDQKSNVTLSYPSETSDPSLGMPHLYYQIRDGRHRAMSPLPYSDAKFELPPWF
jgi:branched-chain amino acid transport system substrate-binding protein